MKNGLIFALALLIGPVQALAASKTSASRSLSYSSVREDATFEQIGLGVSVNTQDIIRTNTALSAYFNINNASALQAYFALGGTKPFSFGTGGIYKYTISSNRYSGFHLGGGMGLGLTQTVSDPSAFFVNLNGVAGIRFAFPNLRNILFNLDAGPTLSFVSGETAFASNVLGLSVHYLF